MKKLELRTITGIRESLSFLGGDPKALEAAWETSKDAQDFLRKANRLPLHRPLTLSLDTKSFASFAIEDCFGGRHILRAYKG